jgi:hypothetical protein
VVERHAEEVAGLAWAVARRAKVKIHAVIVCPIHNWVVVRRNGQRVKHSACPTRRSESARTRNVLDPRTAEEGYVPSLPKVTRRWVSRAAEAVVEVCNVIPRGAQSAGSIQWTRSAYAAAHSPRGSGKYGEAGRCPAPA